MSGFSESSRLLSDAYFGCRDLSGAVAEPNVDLERAKRTTNVTTVVCPAEIALFMGCKELCFAPWMRIR